MNDGLPLAKTRYRFPTLNGTLLTPSGIFAMQAFFGARQYTPADAILNLAVLGLCIAAVLLLLERFLQREGRRA